MPRQSLQHKSRHRGHTDRTCVASHVLDVDVKHTKQMTWIEPVTAVAASSHHRLPNWVFNDSPRGLDIARR